MFFRKFYFTIGFIKFQNFICLPDFELSLNLNQKLGKHFYKNHIMKSVLKTFSQKNLSRVTQTLLFLFAWPVYNKINNFYLLYSGRH